MPMTAHPIIKNSYSGKAYMILGFFFIICVNVSGQNQVLADSLELIYTRGQYEEKDRLQLLNNLAANHADPEKSLQFAK